MDLEMQDEDVVALDALGKIVEFFPLLRKCDFLWLLERIQADMTRRPNV